MYICYFQLKLFKIDILYISLALKLTKRQLMFAGQNREAHYGRCYLCALILSHLFHYALYEDHRLTVFFIFSYIYNIQLFKRFIC